MSSLGDVSYNDTATGEIDELKEVVDGRRHILFSTYNCQIHHNASSIVLLIISSAKERQDTAESSYLIDDCFTISESCPHSSLPSIFSAVGPLLTVRTIINQNGSCIVDLFVGDRHGGQPFNRSGINHRPPLPQLSRNRSLLIHVITKWHWTGSTRCSKNISQACIFQNMRWERNCAVIAVHSHTRTLCAWVSDKYLIYR